MESPSPSAISGVMFWIFRPSLGVSVDFSSSISRLWADLSFCSPSFTVRVMVLPFLIILTLALEPTG